MEIRGRLARAERGICGRPFCERGGVVMGCGVVCAWIVVMYRLFS
jgi:hypothetical protein